MERNLVALVIGNALYQHAGVLRNPTNDADDIAKELERVGFSVTKLTNVAKSEMESAVYNFATALKTSSVGLVFFAGHAFQIDGKNYLAAVDTASGNEVMAKNTSLDLALILDALKYGTARTGFVILDACRNNPFRGLNCSGAWDDLATVLAPQGTLIAFSTSPGEKAADGTNRNGSVAKTLEALGGILAVGPLSVSQPNILGPQESLQQSLLAHLKALYIAGGPVPSP